MRIIALSTLFALAFSGGPAFGQALMQDFSFADLRQQMLDLKSTVETEGVTDTGVRYLKGKDEGGLIYFLYGQQCDSREPAQRCRGLEIVSSFSLDSEEDVEEAVDLVDYAAVSDDKGGEDELRLNRYVIFDHGITPGNLKVNLEVFLSISNKVWKLLEEEGLIQ